MFQLLLKKTSFVAIKLSSAKNEGRKKRLATKGLKYDLTT